MRHPWLPLLSLLLGAGCSDLPELAAGTCGNHALDSGEECDAAELGCGTPGSAAECRYICSASGSVACPGGYVCGTDLACRRPLGTFRGCDPTGEDDDWVSTADLDLDGVHEVLARSITQITVYGMGT